MPQIAMPVSLGSPRSIPKPVAEALERLLTRINKDEAEGGGLLSRETHRCAGELLRTISQGEGHAVENA